MSPWLRVVEAFLVQQLLRTPAFHRAVEKVAKGVHRVRHGIPPEEMGGTKIDQPGQSGVFGHFLDEVKTQAGLESKAANGGSGNAGVNVDSRAMSHAGGQKSVVEQTAAKVDEMNAEAAWRDAQKNAAQPPKQDFLGAFGETLRDQFRGTKKP